MIAWDSALEIIACSSCWCGAALPMSIWASIGGSTGTPLYTYRGHTGEVWVLKWSPDGRRIASASSDGTVQVWDALTGQH
jgi:WD40 repeat protein